MPSSFGAKPIMLKLHSSKQQHKVFSAKLTNSIRITINGSVQRWKPAGSTGTGRVDGPVGLPVGSRFFDWPVKPVEKPVKFSFLATQRHLSTNRNILIYSIINKTFHKKSVLTNHIFRKHLLNGFKL